MISVRSASLPLLLGAALLLASANGEFAGWTVSDGPQVCLMVEMAIKVNVSYNTTDNKTVFGEYEIPNNRTKVDVGGSKCNATENHLVVTWPEGNNFTMTFSLTNGSYDLSNFVITLNASNVFVNATANQTIAATFIDEGSVFMTKGNFSYHCTREQTLNHTASTNNTITIGRVQFEAFRKSTTKEFSLAKDCDSNIKPDIVPIAVGLSLIALIIVVLVAYIVGRRRQQARGYLNIM